MCSSDLDLFPSIKEDNLNEFLSYLVEKNLKENPELQEQYSRGYINPHTIIKNDLPRFVKINELKEVAMQHGFDLTASTESSKTPNNLSVTTRLGLESMMDEYFLHGMPRDLADYHDNFQHNVRILAGDQNLDALLPADEHKVLVDLLLNQDQHRQDILALLYDPNQAMLGWNNAQRDNMIRIIENWLHIHPFTE